MRIDKFLKVSRIIKRRTVANDACDADKIEVNGRSVKASYRVKIGDVIQVTMGTKCVKVKVCEISEHTTKEAASKMYQIIE